MGEPAQKCWRGSMNCALLADGDHDLSEGLRGLLAAVFKSVFVVSDEATLREGAARLQPSLVVFPLTLAAGRLEGLIGSLRRDAPEAKLLVITVHDEPVATSAVLAAGADGVVVTHTIATDLFPAIEEVLAGGRYRSTPARGSASGRERLA